MNLSTEKKIMDLENCGCQGGGWGLEGGLSLCLIFVEGLLILIVIIILRFFSWFFFFFKYLLDVF